MSTSSGSAPERGGDAVHHLGGVAAPCSPVATLALRDTTVKAAEPAVGHVVAADGDAGTVEAAAGEHGRRRAGWSAATTTKSSSGVLDADRLRRGRGTRGAVRSSDESGMRPVAGVRGSRSVAQPAGGQPVAAPACRRPGRGARLLRAARGPTSAPAGPGSACHGRASSADRRGRRAGGLGPSAVGAGPARRRRRALRPLGPRPSRVWSPGTDPDHPEFWGCAGDHDQRLVEMAALGVGLAPGPDRAVGSARAGERGPAWWRGCRRSTRCALHPNNWQFFRVLVDLGLARVGVGLRRRRPRRRRSTADRRPLSGRRLVRGRSERPVRLVRRDGLPHLRAASTPRPGSATRPTPSGSAGGHETLRRHLEPVVRARRRVAALRPVDDLSLRPRPRSGPPWRWPTRRRSAGAGSRASTCANLRHWAGRPIADDDGVLSLGYGYASERLLEPYSSPGSPYWAMKAFLAAGRGRGPPVLAGRRGAGSPPTRSR